jgi:hypothetical protein
LLYFILLAGGLWHVLGWFQTVMTLIAGPLLIALNLWLLMEGWIALSAGERQTLVWWAGFVGIGGFFVEWLGSRTGLIFGVYRYSQVLQPQIAGVPVAIGFSWIGISLASLAVAQRLWKMFRDRQNFLLFTLGAAAMMVLFDRLLNRRQSGCSIGNGRTTSCHGKISSPGVFWAFSFLLSREPSNNSNAFRYCGCTPTSPRRFTLYL